MGTSTWPPAGTPSWPHAGTFSWPRTFEPDEQVCAGIRDLEQPVYALSNNGPLFSTCLSDPLAEVRQLFESIFLSWQLKARKPDVVAFRRFADQVSEGSSDLVLIDDSVQNCRGAEAAGWHAIHYSDWPATATQLHQPGSDVADMAVVKSRFEDGR